MALQNLQQYDCQTGNKLKEKSRDLNQSSSFFSNKNETMFCSGYENCPEFGVLGGVNFKVDSEHRKMRAKQQHVCKEMNQYILYVRSIPTGNGF